MTVQIGPLQRQDAARCAELERKLFAGDDPWRPQAFVEALAAGHHYIAARQHGRLVGYAGIALLGSEACSQGRATDAEACSQGRAIDTEACSQGRAIDTEAEVHTLAVDTSWQGRGIGRALLRELLARVPGATVFLEVRTDNEPAIALYRSEGFTVVGTRRGYYRPSGADAFTMRCLPTGRPR